MNVIQRIGKILGIKAKAQATNYGKFERWFLPTNVFERHRAGILADNETIFAAVSRLANTLASLPLKVYDNNLRAVNTPISLLMAHAPNPNMTSFEFFQTAETMRNTTGNAYALKDYDDNYQVRALWLLDPSRVTPVIEKTTKERWYQIDGDKGRYFVHNLDIIHTRHICTFGAGKGISPIDVLRNTVDFHSKVKDFSLANLQNAITVSFILNMATAISEEKKAEILTHFRNFYRENGGILIEEQGTRITPIEQRSYIDPKLFEAEKITRARVASIYNMPVSMLSESETEEVSYQSFVTYTELPIVRQYEQELNRKLLTDDERARGYHFKFNLSALLRADMKTRADYYMKAIRSGWKTPNEVRALEEDPPLAGGDQLFVSGDLYPIIQERAKK